MYISRSIEPLIEKHIFKENVITIYGARQVGKTTLVEKILSGHSALESKYFNCDEGEVQKLFSEASSSKDLKKLIGEAKLIVIDEAQRINNIGLKLKLIVDNFPDQQIIATGSSSFDLASEITEPLTGRNLEFWLYPFSVDELVPDRNFLDFRSQLENLLVYGSYPSVSQAIYPEDKKIAISKISSNYLYKDILKFQNLKSSELVRKLLEALALQLGGEVSYTELGRVVGVSKQTVESYIELLEKVFIIFRLNPLSRNKRKELGKLRKIYFFDLGIRNALINNFNPLSLRTDIGALWENFVVAEKKKQANFIGNQTLLYFWRTYDKQEVDLIEEKGGAFSAYEIKWVRPKKQPPKAWSQGYTNSTWETITKENYLESTLFNLS